MAKPVVGVALEALVRHVATGPGFNAGVEVEHIVPLAPSDQVKTAHFDRQIQQYIARAQMRGQQLGVVVGREGLPLQADAHGLRCSGPFQIGCPSRDARRRYLQDLNKQRHQTLADSAKADEEEAGCVGFQRREVINAEAARAQESWWGERSDVRRCSGLDVMRTDVKAELYLKK